MAELAYNNANNASTGYTSFKLNCGYHPYVFYEENLNPCLKSKSAEELSPELWKLMTVCQQNLHYIYELEKQAHDKGVKPQIYALGDKI